MPKTNSRKTLHENIRARYMEQVIAYFKEKEEEVLRTNSQEIAIPCLDEEGNDEYIVITFKVPTGSRDGDPYDGYAMAEEYVIKEKQKAEKAQAQAEAKAKKIARDRAEREAKAKAKAEREKAKAEEN